jgi:hypothetical protein
MHPEADADEVAAAAAANQQRSGTSVLAALAEQTQRTVEQQSRMRPPPAGAAAAAAAAAAGGGGEMSAIVDVVMQHLLSKDVLYQPMKVGTQQQATVQLDACVYNVTYALSYVVVQHASAPVGGRSHEHPHCCLTLTILVLLAVKHTSQCARPSSSTPTFTFTPAGDHG